MAKDKVSAKGAKPKKGDDATKVLTSVKGGNVNKSALSSKAKSQELAKKVAGKADKAALKAKKPVEESSEEESEGEDESETSESSESSESEAEAPAPKPNGAAKAAGTVNDKAGVAAKPLTESETEEGSESESEGESGSESGSESDASEEENVPKAVAPTVKPNGAAAAQKKESAAAKDDASEDNDSEDEEDSDDESDEDKPKNKGPVDAAALTDAMKKVPDREGSDGEKSDSKGSGEGSDDESEEDSEEDSSEEEEEKTVPQPKKRKAEAEVAPVAKKTKADAPVDGGSTNLFVGNLSWNTDEYALRAAFEEFGELSGARIVTDRQTGKPRGFGYVEFVDASSAQKAYDEMKGTQIDGRPINLDFANSKKGDGDGRQQQRAKSFGDQMSPPSATLFVGNVSFDASEEIIGQAFSEHASVVHVRLPTNPENGYIKGFGYVEFASVDDATTALNAMQGAHIAGRPLRLDYSTPRADGGGGGNRGGFGGDRRGGFAGDRRGGFGGGRGDRGGRGGFRGGRGDRGGRGGGRGDFRGGRGGSTNRGGFGDFKGTRQTFD